MSLANAPSRAPDAKACCSPARPQPNAAPKDIPDLSAACAPNQNVRAIPGGRALLGTDSPCIAEDEESPLRKIKINPFWMDESAVTNEQYKKFVDETGYTTQAELFGESFVFCGLVNGSNSDSQRVAAAPWWLAVKKADWRRPYGPGSEKERRPDHPVVHVSWHDAAAYAKWAGGRLPTEAEWEHAARGGLKDVLFPWGDKEPDDATFFPCNIWQGKFPGSNSQNDGYYGTAPARSFEANGYGLYNMSGNTWEWTADPFTVRSLRKKLKQFHAGKEGFKILKGGSYLCHSSYCYRYRIAARTSSSPDSSTSHQGFRLVYDKA